MVTFIQCLRLREAPRSLTVFLKVMNAKLNILLEIYFAAMQYTVNYIHCRLNVAKQPQQHNNNKKTGKFVELFLLL